MSTELLKVSEDKTIYVSADCYVVMSYLLDCWLNQELEEKAKQSLDQRMREIILAEIRGKLVGCCNKKAIVAYAEIVHNLNQRFPLPYSKDLFQSQGQFLLDVMAGVQPDDSRFLPSERRLIDDCIGNVHLLS